MWAARVYHARVGLLVCRRGCWSAIGAPWERRSLGAVGRRSYRQRRLGLYVRRERPGVARQVERDRRPEPRATGEAC